MSLIAVPMARVNILLPNLFFCEAKKRKTDNFCEKFFSLFKQSSYMYIILNFTAKVDLR